MVKGISGNFLNIIIRCEGKKKVMEWPRFCEGCGQIFTFLLLKLQY